jgi:beta-galactosidase
MERILKAITADVLSETSNHVSALKNNYGKGTVYWIPSLIGLGSRVQNDYTQLNQFLANVLDHSNSSFIFESPQKGLLMKVLSSGHDMVTIIINKSAEKKLFKLIAQTNAKPVVLFANKTGSVQGLTINIDAEETLVIKWM